MYRASLKRMGPMGMMRFIILGLLLQSSVGYGHALAPSLLSVTLSTDTEGWVVWKEPSNRARGSELAPVFPAGCKRQQDPTISLEGNAVEYRWPLRCDRSLMGRRILIQGLDESPLSVLVEVSGPHGHYGSQLLGREQPFFRLPAQTETTASAWQTVTTYLSSGIYHLWSGWDHLLFVFALFVLLKKTPGVLLGAVTAFTVGHSVTLAAVSLGWIGVNSQWVEQAIAVSLLFMAFELLSSQREGKGVSITRWPYLLTGGFGLLHGLGFASVLSELLSRNATKLLPLMSFNIGIEIGQCILLLLLAGLLAMGQKIPYSHIAHRVLRWRRVVVGYGIGMMSMYWLMMRGWG